MNREQRRRESLYKNFKDTLAGSREVPVYDENDLLDIFDYANDVYDEYVQLEVILLAARLYPESEEMAQRKAYFLYGNLSMTEGAVNMVNAHRDESALWNVLALLVEHPEEAVCRERMDSILSRYSDFDDETAIQIVDACSDLGIFDWLISNKAQLLEKSAYPDTLLYEMAMEADSKGDFELAAALLEELTEHAPFNASFWHLLSQTQVKLGHYGDALSSIDYALAIDGSSAQYKLTKAQILFDARIDAVKAIGMVREVVKSDGDDMLAVHTLAAMLAIDGKEGEALELLNDYFGRHPYEKEAVEHLLMIGDPVLNAEVLKRYYAATSPDPEEWVAWAQSFYARDLYQACVDILLTLLQHTGRLPDWTPLLEGLYRDKRYTTVVELYRDYILKATEADGLDLSLTDALIFVLSLIRCGLDVAARKLMGIVDKVEVNEILPYEKRIVAIGARTVLHNIAEAMDGNDPDFIDRIDPFC